MTASINCLKCGHQKLITKENVKNITGLGNAEFADLLKLKNTVACSKCGTGGLYRIVDQRSKKVVVDSRITVFCQTCSLPVCCDSIYRIFTKQQNKCNRCLANTSPEAGIFSCQNPDLINFFSWHLPQNDVYFSKELIQNFVQTGIAGYQVRHQSNALSFVKDYSTAIDIGAHFGFWTKNLESKFQNVVAVEPNPKCIPVLRSNTQKSHIIQSGLGHSHSKKYLNTIDVNSGGSFISENLEQGSVAVDIVTLDSLNLDDIGFIKIDVEGYEANVLRGAHETILNSKPVICIESKVHSHHQINTRDPVKYLIEELGYKVVGKHVDDWVMEYSKN